MFTLTIFGFGPENGSTKGTLGMKFEPERLAFGGVACMVIFGVQIYFILPKNLEGCFL